MNFVRRVLGRLTTKNAASSTVEVQPTERIRMGLVDLSLWQSRALACLEGGAVGDALGYEVEFMSYVDIRLTHPRGLRLIENGVLEASDDTQMTLFGLRAVTTVMEEGFRSADHRFEEVLLDRVRYAYLEWHDGQTLKTSASQPPGALSGEPSMRARRAPGMTCLSALGRGGRGTIDVPINDSKGCGGVMRAAPFGLIDGIDGDMAERLGQAAAALTHGHRDGWLPAGAMARIVHAVTGGAGLHVAVRGAIGKLPPSDTRTLLLLALEMGEDQNCHASGDSMTELLGQGWTGDEALAVGVYAVLKGEYFHAVMDRAAMHSGDSDSTASIAGQLLGATGAPMPDRYLDAVDMMPLLRRETARFFAVNLPN